MNIIKNNPLVSVVLSTYNDEKYLRASIEAVLAQTYKNFEFIIWNDGSNDSTEDIIKSFTDERIRYFYHDNTGLGKALALACKEAKGKYIARIDGDDICLPYRLEKEVEYLETHTNTVLVSSSVFYIDKEGTVLGCSYPWTWNRNIKHLLNIVHPASMFRRDIYERTCGYLDIKSAQDRVLWSKMSKFGKFAIIKDPLIQYRWVQTSLSHAIDQSSKYARLLEAVRRQLCEDDQITQTDINLHNDLYQLSKRTVRCNSGEYRKSQEDRINDVLRKFLGDKISRSLLIFCKNIYALIKY